MDSRGQDTGAERLAEEGLYEAVAAAAHRTALAVLRDPEAARDLSQDACLEVLEAIAAGRKIDDPPAYGATVAFHKATAEKARRQRTTLLEDAPAHTDDPLRKMEATKLAWEAMEVLTDTQRTAVILRKVEGFSLDRVGAVLGDYTGNAANQLIRRSIDRMLARCVEIISSRPDQPAECKQRPMQVWRLIAGKLKGAERDELLGHIKTCRYCSDTREDLGNASDLPAFAPLFPLDEVMSRKQEVFRKVAQRVAAKAPPTNRLPNRIAIPAAAAVLLLVIGGIALGPKLLPRHSPPQPLLVAASPSPSPVPPPAGGLAYLAKGDVYYLGAIGGTPTQLSNTGGLVDDLAWAGDGRSVLYKQRAPGSEIGDLYQVDLATQKVVWSLKAGAASFAISPDGSSYVAVVPVAGPKAIYSFHLLIGSIGSDPDPAREIDIPNGYDASTTSGYVSEYGPVLWRTTFGAIEVWWTAAGINLRVSPGDGYDIDASTKSVAYRRVENVLDPTLIVQAPANSQITAVQGDLHLTYKGVTTIKSYGGLLRAVVFLSVNREGDKGLATVGRPDGGHDVYLINVDGSETPLSTDGSTALAAWQPPLK